MIPKDSLASALARVVKHNIYSFARTESIHQASCIMHHGGKKRKFVGSQWQGSDVRTEYATRELHGVNTVNM